MKVLTLFLPKVLISECNNKQTIRLLVDKSAKIQTKLCLVDIHSHWLKQEIQRQSITINRIPTKKMMVNGLSKSLSVIKFIYFVRITGLKKKKELLAFIKQEDHFLDVF